MPAVGFNNNAGNARVTPIQGSSRQNEPSSSQATQQPSDEDDVDRGWAFVVMIVSFVIHFIIDGVCLSFGVFFIEILNEFKDEGVSKVLMVGSISLGMYMFVGKQSAFKFFGFGFLFFFFYFSHLIFGLSRYSPLPLNTGSYTHFTYTQER